MKVVAIVPAAGKGERMGPGLKKPYLLLNGRPILYYVLAVLDQTTAIAQLIIAVYPGEEGICQKEIVQKFSFKKDVNIISGGETRQDSVRQALKFLPQNCTMVLIHDGARPLISQQMIENAIQTTEKWRATAMGVPVKDTIKIVKEDGIIETTPSRKKLWSIQTPQTFEKKLLLEAYHKAYQDGFNGTDDASLVERLGVSVKIIRGSYENIKITTKEDLLVAQAILRKGHKGINENWSGL